MSAPAFEPRFCEHGVWTSLRCYDCEAESCKCGPFDPQDPYYMCENCERIASTHQDRDNVK